jgi:hypothetical protein
MSPNAPPLNEPGFWSLTRYNDVSLLVANEIERHILRPGTPGSTHEPDGSPILYLAATRPEDAPLGNWLPAPEGKFNVALRTYLLKPAIERYGS